MRRQGRTRRNPACFSRLCRVSFLNSAYGLIDIALELERIALEDDYCISHKLYPNVDF